MRVNDIYVYYIIKEKKSKYILLKWEKSLEKEKK